MQSTDQSHSIASSYIYDSPHPNSFHHSEAWWSNLSHPSESPGYRRVASRGTGVGWQSGDQGVRRGVLLWLQQRWFRPLRMCRRGSRIGRVHRTWKDRWSWVDGRNGLDFIFIYAGHKENVTVQFNSSTGSIEAIIKITKMCFPETYHKSLTIIQ